MRKCAGKATAEADSRVAAHTHEKNLTVLASRLAWIGRVNARPRALGVNMEPVPLWAKKLETECWMINDHGKWLNGFYARETAAKYHKTALTPYYLDVCRVRVTIEPIAQQGGEHGD